MTSTSSRHEPDSPEDQPERDIPLAAEIESDPAIGASPAAGDDTADSVPKPRRKIVFAVVALALFMSSVDQTIVATALGTLTRDLHAPLAWSGWTITIYALGQIVAMPVVGKISDQYGRKQVFLAAAAVFTLASLCCGFAPNIYWLVALRAVQSIGGGAFLPAANGIVSDMFGRDRDRALGMFTSIFPIGAVVGPILGGIFVEYWTWRGIFLINVPIGIILMLLAVRLIPKLPASGRQRFDFSGVALLGVTVIAFMVGITNLGSAHAGISDPGVAVPVVVGLAFGCLFVRHTRKHAAPFIPARLLYGPGFGVMNLINFLFGCAALGFGALVPLYAQSRYGISSLSGGSLLIARAVGMICVAGIAVMLMRRTGCRPPMLAGNLTLAAGLVTMSLPAPGGIAPYWWLCATAAVTGLGMGMAIPASNNAILQFARDEIAAVSGLRGMFRQCGGIVAVSVSTAVVARSANPGLAFAYLFVGFAGLVVLSTPLVFLVPNHRGRL